MTDILLIAVAAIIGYLLGSLNFAIIISKYVKGSDIRNVGSGNAGATNMLRANGKLPAFFTALGDSAKCVAAVIIGRLIFGEIGAIVAGTLCLLGHCYPIYFGFRGGKGVITSAILGLIIEPVPTLIAMAVFALVFLLTRFVSLGSCIGMIVFAIINVFFNPESLPMIIWGIVVALFVVFQHRSNIKRLIKGTESKMYY